MRLGRDYLRLGLFACVLLIAVPSLALANTIVFGITYLPPEACNQEWTWSGCTARITQTGYTDPGGFGNCYFSQPYGKIKMYPARLEIDLSTLDSIDRIEVDVNELELMGYTKAYAYRYGESSPFVQSSSTKTGAQTLALDITDGRPVEFAVACYDCEVTQVRLISADAIIPVRLDAFGTIKGVFGAD
jgi:hypothetical protein